MLINSKERITDTVCKEINEITCISELQEAKRNYSEFLVGFPKFYSDRIYEAMKNKEKQLS